jgi:hypothetical protein
MGVAALKRHRCRPGPVAGALGREARRPADRPSRATGFESAACVESCDPTATLDDLISGVWESLGMRETVCCPACGGAMASIRNVTAPRADAASDALRGECEGCGAQLS